MQELITAIETVAALPSYQAAALAYAPEIARFQPGAVGVFMGYDFHLGPDGPKLIEINTNAGGALINAYLLQAQRACCAEMGMADAAHIDINVLLEDFVASFKNEWGKQSRTAPLKSIAIVDATPSEQYLYPEFVLFQRLFERHGIAAVIAAPEQLEFRDGGLWLGGKRIDLVYDRLTDFDLSTPNTRAPRRAYLSGEVIVTPNPRARVLYANKRNLTLLSDAAKLRDWGMPQPMIATLLAGIPRTELVANTDAADLWARRGKLFFKPCSGYGGKAAYRGDKVQSAPPARRDANQFRLFLHRAAYWLLHSLRLAARKKSRWRGATFETIRTMFVKIACRVEELKHSIKMSFASALPQADALSQITARLTARGS